MSKIITEQKTPTSPWIKEIGGVFEAFAYVARDIGVEKKR